MSEYRDLMKSLMQPEQRSPYADVMDSLMPKDTPEAAPATPEPQQSTAAKVLAPAGSFASGVNKFVTTGLPGLPMDTLANVLDLIKAGAGTAYGAATGKSPPEVLDPMNRETVPGTSAWLQRLIGSTKVGDQIINSGAQQYPITHAAGQGVGAALTMRPASAASTAPVLPALARDAAMAGVSNAAAQGTYEATGRPEAAVLASLIPQAATTGGAATVRRLARSDPAAMQARIAALQEAGIQNPSAGLASGNRGILGIENLLANTPGASNVMRNASEANLAGMEGAAARVRDLSSPQYGAIPTGLAIQNDVRNVTIPNWIANEGLLQAEVANSVKGGVPQAGALAATTRLTTPTPGAENQSRMLMIPRIGAFRDAIAADQAGTPAQVIPSRILTENGTPFTTTIPAQPGMVPYSAVKEVRTNVGQQMDTGPLLRNPEQAQWRQVYGAMTGDMANAAAAAGPSARTSFDLANRYWTSMKAREGLLDSIVNRDTPEAVYGAARRATESSPTTMRTLTKSVTPETRGTFAATTIDDLGRARPGQQNADGSAWSPSTFLTNWNRMAPDARRMVFKGYPNAPEVAQNMDAIARAADELRQSNKLWQNPSNSANVAFTRGTFGAVTLGAVLSPFVPGAGAAAATAATGMVGANLTARLLTSPKFVEWLAQSTKIPDQRALVHLSRLAVMANEERDPETKAAMEGVLARLQEQPR